MLMKRKTANKNSKYSIKCIIEIQQSKYAQLLVVHIRAYIVTTFSESCTFSESLCESQSDI